MVRGNGKEHRGNNGNLRPWKPGQSGNPKGRPKGTTGPSLMAQLNALMDQDDPDGSKRWALVTALYEKARGGDMKAMQLIMDRTDPVKGLELTVNNNAMSAADIREYLDSIEVRPIKAKARRNGNGRGASHTA